MRITTTVLEVHTVFQDYPLEGRVAVRGYWHCNNCGAEDGYWYVLDDELESEARQHLAECAEA